ncbi:hypothetical protein AAH446_15480 [Erwinia sp. P6884]
MDKLEIAYNAEKSWPTVIITSGGCYRVRGNLAGLKASILDSEFKGEF